MAISQGIFKLLVAKKQSALGTKATASGAQYMRRVTSNLDLSKDTYESAEILQSQQSRDMRHGLRKVLSLLLQKIGWLMGLKLDR